MLFYWIIGGISFILLGLVMVGVVIGMHLGGVMPEWLEKIIFVLIMMCISAAIGLILTTINKYLPNKSHKDEKISHLSSRTW